MHGKTDVIGLACFSIDRDFCEEESSVSKWLDKSRILLNFASLRILYNDKKEMQ